MTSGKPPLPYGRISTLLHSRNSVNSCKGVVFNRTYRDSYELKIRAPRIVWVFLPTFLLLADIPFLPSIYGATAPSGPWPPSQDASIHPYFQLFSSILLSPAVVMHSSGPHPPIWFLVLWCKTYRLKLFLESFLLPFLLCDLPIVIFWF